MASPDFGIKTRWQAFVSRICFWGTPPDRVSARFLANEMNEFYLDIEKVVVAMRLIFPRNNQDRTTRLKKKYPFDFAVLNTIRYWKIETISSELGKLQAHPRTTVVREFREILRQIYRPLFILELIEPEIHLLQALQHLAEQVETDDVANNDVARRRLSSLSTIVGDYKKVQKDVRYYLYPLLLKLLSDVCLDYDEFFAGRRNRLMHFLDVTEEDRIIPPEISDKEQKTAQEAAPDDQKDAEKAEDADTNDEEKQQEAEDKALERGLSILEMLFPKAGWDNLQNFPDLYPYFVRTLDLTRNSEYIDPQSPLQQALILSQILEELFYGFRSIEFYNAGPDDSSSLVSIINNWNTAFETGFDREYIPRIVEYSKFFDGSQYTDGRRAYGAKLLNGINWVKKSYFMPYFKFESFTPPSFDTRNVDAIYPKVRIIRRELSRITKSLEAQKNDTLESTFEPSFAQDNASVELTVKNPLAPYQFAVSNPLSKRLNLLLPHSQRNNTSLIFFTFAIITVLDHLLNSPSSWAYSCNDAKIFRSSDDEGRHPCAWSGSPIDANALFMKSLDDMKKKNLEQKAAG
jgi:hypothetical protein